MRRKAKRVKRTPKGAMNPLLSQADQGKPYIVKAFIVKPEVTLLDDDGKEMRRYLPIDLAIHEAQLGDTLPELMEKLGLKMGQAKGGK